jgi:isopentenyl-diphosphate delta-isomerase
MTKLNIVNEDGEIIGEDTRENIHKKGLLHREIHVWFYTPKGEIIFQLRGKNKDTFPNLLDATVGGHVDLGDSFEEAAIREVEEETGLDVKISDLKLIDRVRKTAKDPVTGMTNNALRMIYAYKYEGEVSKLQVEGEKGQGFEAWSIDKLVKGLTEEENKRFIPSMLSKEYINLYRKMEKLT